MYVRVDVEYTYGHLIERRSDIVIGKMPLMLGCSNCCLRNKTPRELAAVKECPYDPRGYFIIKGVEKVILIQEQMSKNRIIVELDAKKNYSASVISSTHDTKARTTITLKNGKFYMKHNSFDSEIAIFAIFKAMGIEAEQEIAQMIGSDVSYLDTISLSLQECFQLNIHTQKQALEYLASKMKSFKYASKRVTLLEDTKAMLRKVILAHIPAPQFNFSAKCRYLALMIRRIIDAMNDREKLDDKVQLASRSRTTTATSGSSSPDSSSPSSSRTCSRCSTQA
jgi:DNA-directed RNA polymerase III subunit RPC2